MRFAFLRSLAGVVAACSIVAQAQQETSQTTQADPRLGPPKDLNGYFPFTPSESPEAWAKRAEEVRMRIMVSQGIWPEPTRTPLNAVVHGRVEQADYTVEKVYFESMPGFYVTGSLFRPKGKTGPHPAVLCPHGHWKDGRLGIRTDAELKKELETGQEHLTTGGRSIFQSLGVQLARMGCVALVYDMMGYADSHQIPHDVVHKFSRQEPGMNTPDAWRLFSPSAEAHLQSVMGLHTWNSIRALDFLTTLPDVDPQRIAMTGGSGGGTQTFICGAIDPRVKVAFPSVMVSTAMQGGCTCENACLLRIGTGNVEIAALFAPRPMGMTAANDWTREVENKGYPELRAHWAMLGHPNRVQLWAMLQYPHNYNAPSREKIYAWFNRYLGLGLEGPLREREYALLTREQLSVWDETHPAPPSGPEFERTLLQWWKRDATAQMDASEEAFREISGRAWKTIVGRDLPAADSIASEVHPVAGVMDEAATSAGESAPEAAGTDVPQSGGATVAEWRLHHTGAGEKTALWLAQPRGPVAALVLWLHPLGSRALQEDEQLKRAAEELLEAGVAIAVPTLLRQEDADARNVPVKNARESAAYTYGYNHPLLIQRVHDAAAALVALRASAPLSNKPCLLVATGTAAPIGAVLRLHARELIDAAAIEAGGFRFEELDEYLHANFVPGAARYGDLPGLLALNPPKAPLFVLGEEKLPGLEARDGVTVSASRDVGDVIKWLKERAARPVTPGS